MKLLPAILMVEEKLKFFEKRLVNMVTCRAGGGQNLCLLPESIFKNVLPAILRIEEKLEFFEKRFVDLIPYWAGGGIGRRPGLKIPCPSGA